MKEQSLWRATVHIKNELRDTTTEVHVSTESTWKEEAQAQAERILQKKYEQTDWTLVGIIKFVFVSEVYSA